MKQILQVFGGGVSLDVAEVLSRWLAESVQTSKSPMDDTLLHLIRRLNEDKASAVQGALQGHLAGNPSCVYGQLIEASLCLRDNCLEQAKEALQRVYRRQPSHALALYALGHIYERLGQESDAVIHYQDCLKYNDTLELPILRLAAIYAKHGRFEEVIRLYSQVHYCRPADLSIQTILGHLYIAMSDCPAAEDVFNDAILGVPSSYACQDPYLAGLLEEQNLVDAVDYIDQTMEERQETPELWAKKGDLLAQLGATSEAVAAYRRCLQINPSFLEAGVKLGTLYTRDGHYLPAIDVFLRAMEANEQLMEAYVGIALCRCRTGDRQGTLSALTSASMILPNTGLLFAEIGKCMFRSVFPEHCSTGVVDLEPNEAMLFDALVQQVHSHPGNPVGYYHLGLLQIRTADPRTALQSFQTCQGLYADYYRAQIKTILCHLALGDNETAVTSLKAWTIPNRDSLQLHYETAILYWDHVKFAGAMLNLSQQLSKTLTSMDTSAVIAAILETAGVIDPVDSVWDGLQETLLGTQTLFGP